MSPAATFKTCHTVASDPFKVTPPGLTQENAMPGRGPRMLKEFGGVTIQARHRATCHCGAVELELDLPDGIVDPRRCDCSICRRKGAVVASVPLDRKSTRLNSSH